MASRGSARRARVGTRLEVNLKNVSPVQPRYIENTYKVGNVETLRSVADEVLRSTKIDKCFTFPPVYGEGRTRGTGTSRKPFSFVSNPRVTIGVLVPRIAVSE